MNSEQVLQVTKTDLLGSLGGAVVLTSFILFLANVLYETYKYNHSKKIKTLSILVRVNMFGSFLFSSPIYLHV